MTSVPAPGWYGDPSGRFEQRYWDGHYWTGHVSTGGVASEDPPPAAAPQDPTVLVFTEATERDVTGAPFDIATADGTLVATAHSPQQGRGLSNVTRDDIYTEYRTVDGELRFVHMVRGGIFGADVHHVFLPSGEPLGTLDIDLGFGSVKVKVAIGGQPAALLQNHNGLLAYTATDPAGQLLARYANDRRGEFFRGRGQGGDIWTVELAPGLADHLESMLLAATLTLNVRDDRANVSRRRGFGD